MLCPYCSAEIHEGDDMCEECQHSLTHLSLPRIGSPVERGLLNDRISTLDPKQPLTVSPDTPVGEVLEKMVGESIGCVMVVDDGALSGIFSERDALMKLNVDFERLADRPIADVMTPDPITLNSKDKIAFALHKMHVGGYRHLPILTKGKLTGVISIRDILAYLTDRIGVVAGG